MLHFEIECVKIILEGNKLVCEYTSSKRVDYLYDGNGILYGLIYNGNKYFYLRDHLANILGIIDSSGNLVVSYDYYAYGKIKSITGSMASTLGQDNHMRYKGYYFDEETGFYYCKSRYYVPDWCRWLNADLPSFLKPYSATGNNLFAYCSNDPINKVDNTGCFAVSSFLICVGVGAVLGGALGGVTAYSENQDVNAGILTGALLGSAAGAIVGVGSTAILSSAVSSTIGKATTDIIGGVFYGEQYGTWEDYTVAFIFGGISGSLSGGSKFVKGTKAVLDIAVRPAVNQFVKMGTRGKQFDGKKYSYDVFTRGVTYFGSKSVLEGEFLGLNLKVDIGKCFYRATFKFMYSYFEYNDWKIL